MNEQGLSARTPAEPGASPQGQTEARGNKQGEVTSREKHALYQQGLANKKQHGSNRNCNTVQQKRKIKKVFIETKDSTDTENKT